MNREHAITLDIDDPLKYYRGEFLLRDDVIYMDGNSLGPLPKRVIARQQTLLQEQWGTDLIHSWNAHKWIDLPTTVGEKIAPLLGAEAGQVICCDSVSVNLFKLLAAAMDLRPGRRTILSQKDNFPTDLYMAQGLSSLLGENKCTLTFVDGEEIPQAIDEDVAVLLLTEVNFRSGTRHDIKTLTSLAHEKGALVIWDLAHSAGAFPLALDADEVDFAVGCGYKYLNGGPGAPAFIYVAKRLQKEFSQPLCGWMGHRAPFEFSHDYVGAEGMEQCLSGTPPILSMAALDSALDVFKSVKLEDVQRKSIALSELFIQRVKSYASLKTLTMISPDDPSLRGSQLAYSHEQAFAITQALIAKQVIVDFRAPNIIRFGFTPLYMRFIDVFEAVEKLASILASEEYLEEKYQRRMKVT